MKGWLRGVDVAIRRSFDRWRPCIHMNTFSPIWRHFLWTSLVIDLGGLGTRALILTLMPCTDTPRERCLILINSFNGPCKSMFNNRNTMFIHYHPPFKQFYPIAFLSCPNADSPVPRKVFLIGYETRTISALSHVIQFAVFWIIKNLEVNSVYERCLLSRLKQYHANVSDVYQEDVFPGTRSQPATTGIRTIDILLCSRIL